MVIVFITVLLIFICGNIIERFRNQPDNLKYSIIIAALLFIICAFTIISKNLIIDKVVKDYNSGDIVLYEGHYKYIPIDYD